MPSAYRLKISLEAIRNGIKMMRPERAVLLPAKGTKTPDTGVPGPVHAVSGALYPIRPEPVLR